MDEQPEYVFEPGDWVVHVVSKRIMRVQEVNGDSVYCTWNEGGRQTSRTMFCSDLLAPTTPRIVSGASSQTGVHERERVQ